MLRSFVSKGLVSVNLNALARVGGDKGAEIFWAQAGEIGDRAIALSAVIIARGGALEVQPAHRAQRTRVPDRAKVRGITFRHIQWALRRSRVG